MRHSPSTQTILWCLIPSLIISTTGCFQFRQIPGTISSDKDESPRVAIDVLVPTLVEEKAYVKLVLRDGQVIEGRIVGVVTGEGVQPFVEVNTGQRSRYADISKIIEVHRLELNGEDTVDFVGGAIGLIVIIGAFAMFSIN